LTKTCASTAGAASSPPSSAAFFTYVDGLFSIFRSGLTKKGERCKRIRTIFTAEQLNRLEEEFAKQQYMVGSERFYLASKLRLSEAQVKVWFQNRRMKWKRVKGSQMVKDKVTGQLKPISEVDLTLNTLASQTGQLDHV